MNIYHMFRAHTKNYVKTEEVFFFAESTQNTIVLLVPLNTLAKKGTESKHFWQGWVIFTSVTYHFQVSIDDNIIQSIVVQ